MRDNVGSIAPCRRAEEEGWASPDYVVCRLKDDAPVSGEYLFAYVKSEVGKAEITLHSRGAVRRRLYYENLETVPVPVPAEPEQWEALLECRGAMPFSARRRSPSIATARPPRRRRSPRSTTPTEPDAE
jgi:hypothetical protein